MRQSRWNSAFVDEINSVSWDWLGRWKAEKKKHNNKQANKWTHKQVNKLQSRKRAKPCEQFLNGTFNTIINITIVLFRLRPTFLLGRRNIVRVCACGQRKGCSPKWKRVIYIFNHYTYDDPFHQRLHVALLSKRSIQEFLYGKFCFMALWPQYFHKCSTVQWNLDYPSGTGLGCWRTIK